VQERLASRRPIGGPGPAHPRPAPAPPPAHRPLRVAGPRPGAAGTGGRSPTRPGLAWGVRPGPRPLDCGLLPVWDYFPLRVNIYPYWLKFVSNFVWKSGAGGAAEGRAARVRERAWTLGTRRPRQRPGSERASKLRRAGHRGNGAWKVGRGRPRPGRYLQLPAARGELGCEAGLRAASGGGWAVGAFCGGLPRTRAGGRRAAPGEHRPKQSRNKAGNTCVLPPSRFTPRVALTRGWPGGSCLLGHSTSSSASRQYWKPVAAIDHPGNIFILLDIEENMSGRLLPFFFFFKSYVCSFFPFHKYFISLKPQSWNTSRAKSALTLLGCCWNALGSPRKVDLTVLASGVWGMVWWGGWNEWVACNSRPLKRSRPGPGPRPSISQGLEFSAEHTDHKSSLAQSAPRCKQRP
jgi:hypothetical protein